MDDKIIDLDNKKDERSGLEIGTTKLVKKILEKNGEPVISEAKEEKRTDVPEYGKDKKYFEGFSEDVDFEKETDEIIRANYPEKFEKPVESQKKSEKGDENKTNVIEFKLPK